MFKNLVVTKETENEQMRQSLQDMKDQIIQLEQ